MQDHLSEHISMLPDDSFSSFMQYHTGELMSVLPNDVELTSMQGALASVLQHYREAILLYDIIGE